MAIFDSSRGESLVVNAVVERDCGEEGWGLRFVDLTPEAQTQISAIVSSLSPVESLASSDSVNVVPTRIVSNESQDPTR